MIDTEKINQSSFFRIVIDLFLWGVRRLLEHSSDPGWHFSFLKLQTAVKLFTVVCFLILEKDIYYCAPADCGSGENQVKKCFRNLSLSFFHLPFLIVL